MIIAFKFFLSVAWIYVLATGAQAQLSDDQTEALNALNSSAIYTGEWFDYIEATRNPYFLKDLESVEFFVGDQPISSQLAEELCEPTSLDAFKSNLQGINASLLDALETLSCYYDLTGFNVREDNGDIRIVKVFAKDVMVFEEKSHFGPISLYQSWLAVQPNVAFDFAKDVARERNFELLNAALSEQASFLPLPEFVDLIIEHDFVRFMPLGGAFANFRSSSIFKANWALCRTVAGNLWREDPGKRFRAANELQAPEHTAYYNDNCVEKNWGWGLRGDMYAPLGPVFELLNDTSSGIVGDDEPFTSDEEAELLSKLEVLTAAGASVNYTDDDTLPYLQDRPIDIAIRKRSEVLTEYLLDQGATTDHVDGDGFDPLSVAIISGFSIRVIEKIIRNGANLSRTIPFDSLFRAGGVRCTTPNEKRFTVTVRYNALDFAFCHGADEAMLLIAGLMDPVDINCNRLKVARLWDIEENLERNYLEIISAHVGIPDLCAS